MNIAVAGTGYVGMTIATSLAQQNETGTEVNPESWTRLKGSLQNLPPCFLLLSFNKGIGKM